MYSSYPPPAAYQPYQPYAREQQSQDGGQLGGLLLLGLVGAVALAWHRQASRRADAVKFLAGEDRYRRRTGNLTGGRLSEAARQAVLDRDGYRCAYADNPGEYCDGPLEVDHRRSRKYGGTHLSRNLQSLCRSHNASKGARSEY